MSRTKRSFWKISLSVFANVSYETLILEGFLLCFCKCLVRNGHFGRSLCQFLRMSRTKRSFWKTSLSVFANVSYETLLLEDFLVRFCECLVRNAHFGRFPSLFLQMSRTKWSFWKVSLSVFANVSYETLLLEDFLVRFCECLVRNAPFGRLPCPFLRMSRTKRSFWKISLSVFANVSHETRVLEGHFGGKGSETEAKCLFWKIFLCVFANVMPVILHGGLCHAGYSRLRTSTASLGTCTRVSLVDPCRWGESTTQGEIHRHFLDLLSFRIFSHLLVSSSTPSAPHLHNLFFSSHVLTDLITCSSHHIFIYIICSFSLLISSHIFFSLLYT